MKNLAKTAFNVAACVSGATTTAFGLGLYALQNVSVTAGWAGSAGPGLTPLHAGLMAGGALVFAAGYTRFFGSGKTLGLLRRLVGTNPPAP